MEKNEAEVTIKKDANGNYCDRYSGILTEKGIKKLTKKQMMNLFKKLRLRISITSNCNQFCFFCSNEGFCYSSRNYTPPNLDKILKLADMVLKNTPLYQIDLSGGEPLVHPDFIKKEYRLIKWTKKYPNVRFAIHTNGLNLYPEVIDLIKDNFSRIGISIHSTNFETWNKITNPDKIIPLEEQKRRFKVLTENLNYLSKQGIGDKVFLKSVVIGGVNDSEEEIKSFLELCKKLNFHPKFLQFDPQYPSQKNLQVNRKQLFKKLRKIGVKFEENVPLKEEPNKYYPGVNFSYESAPLGLHSLFGCGDLAACKSCYDFLCMFVKFSKDGSRTYLKPCSVLDTQFDLTHAIDTDNFNQLFDLFKLSREYLMTAPGLGSCGWNKEEKYETKIN
jgi:molybdenum cofactor biosynthesis enzyme MoaA